MIIIFICLLISILFNLCLPILNKDIMDKGFMNQDFKLLLILVMVMTILKLLNNILEFYKEKKRIYIAANIKYRLSKKAFEHMLKVKLDKINSTNIGEFMNNMEVDIMNISNIMDSSMFFMITQIFSILGSLIGLFILSPTLTIFVLLFIPLKYKIVKRVSEHKSDITNHFIEVQSEYAKWLYDTLSGLEEIRLFHIEHYKKKQLENKQSKIITDQLKLGKLEQFNVSVDTILIDSLITILYIVGANLVFHMKLSVGSIFAFITYTTYVTTPISSILDIRCYLSGIIPSAKRFYKFLSWEEEESGQNHICDVNEITFENLGFRYDENSNFVLSNIFFKIPQNGKLALIGVNGSGKTTLVQLLLRFYKPTNGSIKLNGKDIQSYDLIEYRNLFSVVSQEIYLFDDSIYNNICLYKDIQNETYEMAIKDSGLQEVIDLKGSDYIIGTNGEYLSGGQKQRLALARALVQDSPIFIFDEATSNVDTFIDIQLKKLFQDRLKNKIVIVITHQVEVLEYVDSIITLNHGKIIEEGALKDLKKTSAILNHMLKDRRNISDKS